MSTVERRGWYLFWELVLGLGMLLIGAVNLWGWWGSVFVAGLFFVLDVTSALAKIR